MDLNDACMVLSRIRDGDAVFDDEKKEACTFAILRMREYKTLTDKLEAALRGKLNE